MDEVLEAVHYRGSGDAQHLPAHEEAGEVIVPLGVGMAEMMTLIDQHDLCGGRRQPAAADRDMAQDLDRYPACLGTPAPLGHQRRRDHHGDRC